MKLQKLVYYAQAWHLALHDKPLFREAIEAWANGPVVRELYNHHRGEYTVVHWPWGDRHQLTTEERASIDWVLATYGAKDAQWLSDETHSELPWQQAREGLPPGARSSAPISVTSMRAFYRAQVRVGRGPDYAALRR
ncbi:MAG: Panacea domain-containing protein [Solirubrobacteraceae bacterium]